MPRGGWCGRPAAAGSRTTNASLQVFPKDGAHCRLVWIADLLPNELSGAIAAMIADGMRAMKKTLEAQTAGPGAQ